jgi:subtilisin family serine protease
MGVHQSAPAGSAQLRAFSGRSAAQRASATTLKLDASLAALVRAAPQVRAERALADLHAVNPAAHFKLSASTAAPLVLIDAVTRTDPRQLAATLQSLGLEKAAIYSNDVGGWLPVSQIEPASARAEVHSLRAAMMRTRAGLVTTQGDFAQGSAALRTSNSLTGAGVTVGVLSDSFNCYAVYEQPGSGVPAKGANGFAQNGFLASAATDEGSGDLPASVDVIEEADCLDYGAPDQLPFADEGRALLQIVHDVAPEAALAFYTADSSEADFAAGIAKLAAAGARVEADDVGYFDEPFFQDGLVAQAIDQAEASGVAYFAAAGNDGTASYDNTAPSFPTLSGSAPNAGEYLLNFDTTGGSVTTALSVAIPALFPGEYVGLVLQWDQPYVTGAPGSPGASSQIDLCVSGAAANPMVIDEDGNAVTCTGPNAAGSDPVQILIVGNPADSSGDSAAENIELSIGLVQGSPAPGRIKLALDGDGAPLAINATFAAASTPTLQGHPSAAGAIAVGASYFWNTPRCGVTPAVLNFYSSRGGEPILFDTAGARLATPELRTKPDVVDADGVNTTFFGYTLASQGVSDPSTITDCSNSADYPNFFGTSAATPHVAGAAALFLQYNAAITPADIYQALRNSADPMAATVPNDDSGYGFVRADQALTQLPAPAAAASTGGHGGGGAVDVASLLALAALSAVCIPRARYRRPIRRPPA